MRNTYSSVFLASVLSALPAASAFSSDVPPPADLFDRAVEAVQRHHDALDEVCAFTLRQEGERGRTLRFADEAGTGQWFDSEEQSLDPEEASLPENGRVMIAVPPERVLQTREPPVFIGWQDGLAIYRLRPPTVPLSGGGFSFDIADNVHADVGIDPETAAVRFREVRAPESFRPNAVVRIRSYETRLEMAPAWPDGPVVITSQRYAIGASAMLQTYDFNGSTRFSGFSRCAG